MKILARTSKMSGIKTHSYFSPTLHKILKNLCEYVVSIFRDHMYNSIWKVRTFLKPVLTILPSWLTANSFPATWPQIHKQKTDVWCCLLLVVVVVLKSFWVMNNCQEADRLTSPITIRVGKIVIFSTDFLMWKENWWYFFMREMSRNRYPQLSQNLSLEHLFFSNKIK